VQEKEFKTYTKEDLENDPNYVIESYDTFGGTKWLVRPANDPNDALVIANSRDYAITRAINFLNEENPPRNIKWTLPGGKNQRELVLTVPSIEPFNTDDTTHYGDVGGGRAVAWVRFNDRVDANGNKTLFIEEVQSKRHQEGKEKGYTGQEVELESTQLPEGYQVVSTEDLRNRGEIFVPDGDYYFIEDTNGIPIIDEDNSPIFSTNRDQVISKAVEILNPGVFDRNAERNYAAAQAVPNAPFKQTIAGSGQTLSGWAGLVF
jgi:hypothetical protein